MGREVRKVPKDWVHPVGNNGPVPLFDRMSYEPSEIAEGIRDGWLKDEPPNYGLDIMPQWNEEEKTHFQMYETCSEGTPISPVMATEEELARWLADNRASACGKMTATYEQWLAMIKAGSAPSMVLRVGHSLVSGVEDRV